MTDWRPMEKAPRDGTAADLWWEEGDGKVTLGHRIPDCTYRGADTWMDNRGNVISEEHITHWRLPPSPPND
jgi:hypothetical protein